MSNAILVIFPYHNQRNWVFDDEQAGLIREPFVQGIPEMIKILVRDILHPETGFQLLFSAYPFPQYQAEITWLRAEYPGHWYAWKAEGLEGWLYPALFKYFDQPPQKIYGKAEQLN